ncbi:MobA/MobL family protein, partial [Xanthomonas citri pv. citri]|nr:MobA/MobL family protein [Xanthomonas citri pv. citri]
MAIYHLSAQIISRKAGRSATAAAAYRSGSEIVDERTGEVHDYSRKQGVLHSEIVMPQGCKWQPDRAELW